MNNFREKANFIWSIADLLRGHYKQADYGKVILPFTVLRRLDMVLEPTKKQVLDAYQKHKDKKPEILEPILNGIAKVKFHNHSKFDFTELAKDHNNVAANLRNYINGFSISAREIIDYFSFEDQIKKLDEYDLLYLVIKHFADAKEKFEVTEPMEMGYIFEELIRKFAEISNETAGEHFTPREVIRLMVNLIFANDKNILRKEGIVKTLYDPACGTGGMLSVADEYLHELNSSARLELFGQELNPESYAICKSDMLIKGQNPTNIKFGNSFSQDGLEDEKFDYMLSNPPFGVDWKKAQKFIKDEYDNKGYAGRFGAGLPSISDGSLLFLQHMISKMKQNVIEGSRIAIVFNGSPLFSGSAGSGPSEIRKWIIENDMLEAIISMPDQLFYNTGIATYIWIVTNRKEKKRKGKVQLINASGSDWEKGDKDNPFYLKMMRSLGNKRKEIGDAKNGKPDHIKTITEIYEAFEESEYCKIFDNEDFGYTRITVERPKRNEKGEIEKDKKGEPIPDAELRDFENIPLKENVEEYFKREVLPHLPDAWIDQSKTKIGYQINFAYYFYTQTLLRKPKDITEIIKQLEENISKSNQASIFEDPKMNIATPNCKHTNIEWIDTIPTNWEIKKLKYEAVVQGGYAFKSDNFVEEGTPIVRIGDIYSPVDLENCRRTSEKDIPNEFKIKKYDVLIALSGATVGKMCFIEEDIEAYINQRVARVNNGSRWLYFVLNSEFFKKQIELLAGGSAQDNISTNDIANFFIPIPPLEERIAIDKYLSEKSFQIKTIISNNQKLSELLQEYHSSLINAVVTGKIKVI